MSRLTPCAVSSCGKNTAVVSSVKRGGDEHPLPAGLWVRNQPSPHSRERTSPWTRSGGCRGASPHPVLQSSSSWCLPRTCQDPIPSPGSSAPLLSLLEQRAQARPGRCPQAALLCVLSSAGCLEAWVGLSCAVKLRRTMQTVEGSASRRCEVQTARCWVNKARSFFKAWLRRPLLLPACLLVPGHTAASWLWLERDILGCLGAASINWAKTVKHFLWEEILLNTQCILT